MNALEEHETGVYVVKAGKMYINETISLAGPIAITPNFESAKYFKKSDAVKFASTVNGTACELVLREENEHED